MDAITDQAPLSGIRVLELGNFIAAPTATRLLADFGAEVIKVERPQTGDELRTWRLYAGDTSMLYRTINRNKKSLTLDLKSELGQQAIRDLAAQVDIIVENFRPGTLEAWNLSPEALSEINPDLIFVRISAFGQTGPRSAQPGFGVVAEAVGGLRELTGDPDRAPARSGISIGDSLAGLYAAFGAMTLLFQRERSSRAPSTTAPRTVDVALSEAVLSVMESLVPDFDAYGVVRERTGGRMQGIAPTNAYLCQDGRSVVIAGNGDSIFRRFMELLGRSDMAEREDLSSNALRWEHREELDDIIAAWTGQRSVEEVVGLLSERGIPASAIYNAEQIVSDEQFLARGMIQTLSTRVEGSEEREVRFAGVVPRIGEQGQRINALGPELGAHSLEILQEIAGYSPEEAQAAAGASAATSQTPQETEKR